MSNHMYVRVFLKDEDPVDLPLTKILVLKKELEEYVETGKDKLLWFTSYEGAEVAFLRSNITSLFGFTPAVRERHERIRFDVKVEVEQIRMDLGGPNYVERMR